MPQSTTQAAPPRRWTADTRIAFLLALRLTGGVRTAAAEIGRDIAGCYKWRERDPGFAAAWDGIVAEQKAARRVALKRPDLIAARAVGVALRAGAGAGPAAGVADEPGVVAGIMKQRTRWDGITPVKRKAFLRALSETGTVASACLAADVSDRAVYRLRGDDADFARTWDRALRTAAPALEQVAWERAVEGWEETVYRGGEVVSTRRRYSETLLRQLIIKRDKAAALNDDPVALVKRAEEAARAAGGSFELPATREETNAAIMKALDGVDRRVANDELRAAEAAGLFDLARWVCGGGVVAAKVSG